MHVFRKMKSYEIAVLKNGPGDMSNFGQRLGHWVRDGGEFRLRN